MTTLVPQTRCIHVYGQSMLRYYSYIPLVQSLRRATREPSRTRSPRNRDHQRGHADAKTSKGRLKSLRNQGDRGQKLGTPQPQGYGFQINIFSIYYRPITNFIGKSCHNQGW